MKERDLMKKILEEKISDKEAIRERAIIVGGTRRYKGVSGMKKKALFAGTLLIAVVMLISLSVYTEPDIEDPTPLNVGAYEKLLSVIENYNSLQNSYTNNYYKNWNGTGMLDDAVAMPEASVNSTADNSDYSSTNVQTKGVDEGDIVKNDGQYIYKLNSTGCIILAANNGDLSVASNIAIENYVPQELYVIGNQMIIIGGIYEQYYYGNIAGISPMYDCMSYISYNNTDIRIYDITSRTEPVLERQITVEGNLFTTRYIEETNELLYIVNYYFNYGSEEDYIPELKDSTINNGEQADMPVDSIYYYEDIANYSYLITGKINLANPENDSEISAFLGLNGTVYVSEANIYVATYDYQSLYKTNIWGWVAYDSESVPKTRIVRISLSDLTQKASGRIEGTIKDRYSMDEYEGYLRVASTVSYGETYSNVYVLKDDLSIAGQINDIAPGETIYSVKFNGTTGSLVTFEQVDPYFNLNLADPFNPTISAGLKEDGVSYYIHYIEGTNYTVGVGRNTRLVTNQYGSWVQWKEIKVTLYDNSSGEAVEITTVYLPSTESEWSCYSALFYEPKALLYNADKGLFAFSYEGWSYDEYYYYNSMIQGLAMFKIDLTAENDADKLQYRGTLTNIAASGVDVNNYDWNIYYNNYLNFIERGVQIGDYVYTVSDHHIVSYDLNTLTEIDRINIYEAE